MTVDPSLHALVARRVTQVLALQATLWWATQAPEDDLDAARAFDDMVRTWEAHANTQAAAAIEQAGDDRDALRAACDQLLPLPPLTPAVARALAEGRRTPWGGPDLSDAEWDAVKAIRHRAAAKAEAATLARAADQLPLDPTAAIRRAQASAAVAEQEATNRDTVQAVFGLRLPDHVFAFHAFWQGLDGDEQALMRWPIGLSPGKLFDFFDGAFETSGDTDPRLHGRFSGTPPEMLHAMRGDGDGLHWGLWYDADDAEPLLASFHGRRDGGTIQGTRQSLLSLVFARARAAQKWVADDTSLTAEQVARLHVRLGRLAAVALALEPGADQAAPLEDRTPTCDGMGAALRGPVAERPPLHVLRRTLRDDLPEISQWVDDARAALARDEPGLALLLGRDLHWHWSTDRPHYQQWAHELLVAAHRQLGNPALAAIADVHAGPARFRASIAALSEKPD